MRPKDELTRSAGRPLDQERENALLDAALEILGEVGFERLTVAAVCERAGASTKTAYRRWSNKEELLAATLRRAVLRETETSRAAHDYGSLRMDLVEIIAEQFGSFRASANLVLSLFVAARASGDLGDIAKELAVTHESAYVREIISRASTRGETTAQLDSARLAAIIRGYFLNAVLVETSRPSREAIAEFVDEVLIPFVERSGAPHR
ncbi:TetR/AcrR family transcriptional regulator [Streptomyces sp. NPDC004044]|uniref:TetR/AcrR family transcriptional regulator n=1 Tax=Streptomyces sp. NPDC005356 TaxID=3157167 RepID=UPI0033B974F2